MRPIRSALHPPVTPNQRTLASKAPRTCFFGRRLQIAPRKTPRLTAESECGARQSCGRKSVKNEYLGDATLHGFAPHPSKVVTEKVTGSMDRPGRWLLARTGL